MRSHAPPVSDEFLDFTSSVHFDGRLCRHDAAGSIAHAHTLERAGVLSQDERKAIVASLKGIARSVETGEAVLRPDLEDIHMNIERMLTDELGPEVGGKLHTGRSRNDQVALDMRLLVREDLARIAEGVIGLQTTLLERAQEAEGIILPGYTHMQHAQPVLLSHHLMAHFWRLQRDLERISDCYARTNVSPLGSGALAGTTFALDRSIAAKMLRMKGVTRNSLDAVSDRDFCAEAAFALSMVMIHLSSLCEELVMWSSSEFGFIALPESLSGGSSMMPQKRNPDIPELVRGKCGRTVGGLIAILTLLKSLPLAYNRDLQEDKENLFGVSDNVESSLLALTSFLAETQFDRVRMRRSAQVGLMTATDLADLLTTSGMSFRKAHGIVRELVLKSGGDESKFLGMAERLLKSRLKGGQASQKGLLSIEKAVDRRSVEGGTSRGVVAKQLVKAQDALASSARRLEKMTREVSAVDELLR